MILDQTIFQPRTREILSPRAEADQHFFPESDKLKDLVLNLVQALYKLHLQQSVELPILTIVAVSVKPKPGHSNLPNPSSSKTSFTTSPITQVVVQPPPPITTTIYSPLVLVSPLHNMPQYYQTRIPHFDSTIPLNAQQHVDKMNDYFYLHKVDEADV
jgi:hypothetical protein